MKIFPMLKSTNHVLGYSLLFLGFLLVAFFSCNKSDMKRPATNQKIEAAKKWVSENVKEDIGFLRWGAAREIKSTNNEDNLINIPSVCRLKGTNKVVRRDIIIITNAKETKGLITEFVLNDAVYKFPKTLADFSGVINTFDIHYNFKKGMLIENGKPTHPIVFKSSSNTQPTSTKKSSSTFRSDEYCYTTMYCYYPLTYAGITCVRTNTCISVAGGWSYADYYGGYEMLVDIYNNNPDISAVEAEEMRAYQKQDDIKDSLKKYPCAKKLIENIFSSGKNINQVALDFVRNLFQKNDDINLFISVDEKLRGTSTDAYSKIQRVTGDSINGYFSDAIISLNPQTLEEAGKEYVFVTILHEMLHIYFDFLKGTISKSEFQEKYPLAWPTEKVPNAFEAAQHEAMATAYLKEMRNALSYYNENMTTEVKDALAWGGLHNTYAWKKLGKDTNNINKINLYGRTAGFHDVPEYKMTRCIETDYPYNYVPYYPITIP